MQFLKCLGMYHELNWFDSLTECDRPSIVMRRVSWPPDFLVQVYREAKFPVYFHYEPESETNSFWTDFCFNLQTDFPGRSFFRGWSPSVEDLLAVDWEISRISHPRTDHKKSQGDANSGPVQA